MLRRSLKGRCVAVRFVLEFIAAIVARVFLVKAGARRHWLLLVAALVCAFLLWIW
jgi:hypothetical protein